ncbi:MAG TPA: Ig domain-containing protein, partial [Acidobacteriaceae bacterium]|nr:Ig domain-containing protein [Acidobacteriaceae bacterium]
GATYTAMATGDVQLETGEVNLSLVNSSPWSCWHQGNNSIYLDQVAMKNWNGTSWTSGGLTAPFVSGVTQGQCQIADVSGVPYVVVRQADNRTTTPQRVYIVVYQWNGSAFVQVGGALNRDGIGAASSGNPQTVAGSVSIVSNGTQPCAVWEEHMIATGTNQLTTTAGQVYAACWNGSAWVNQGGSANINVANRAAAVSATFMGGSLYVAFTEKTATGPAALYMRRWTGTAWTTVGTTSCTNNCLNRDIVNGWVYRPELTNDGASIYITWDESGNDQPWISTYSALPSGYGDIAARPQTFVAKWNGTVWSYLGGSLNMDSTFGAAEHPSIAILSGNPVVTWGEVKHGTLRQIYSRLWNGTDWAALSGNTLAVATSSLPEGTAGSTYLQTLTASGGTPPYVNWVVSSGSLPVGLSLNTSTGVIGGTLSGPPGPSLLSVQVTDSAGTPATATSGALSITTNAAPIITTGSPLPGGTAGSAYNQTLAATGGTSPLTWNISAGSLPAGLTLSAAGTLAGTPTQTGLFNFTVLVSDASSVTNSKTYQLTTSGNSASVKISGAVRIAGKASIK